MKLRSGFNEDNLRLKVYCNPYLAYKAVGCGVWGGAAIRTFKPTFSSSSFAVRLQRADREIVILPYMHDHMHVLVPPNSDREDANSQTEEAATTENAFLNKWHTILLIHVKI